MWIILNQHNRRKALNLLNKKLTKIKQLMTQFLIYSPIIITNTHKITYKPTDKSQRKLTRFNYLSHDKFILKLHQCRTINRCRMHSEKPKRGQ